MRSFTSSGFFHLSANTLPTSPCSLLRPIALSSASSAATSPHGWLLTVLCGTLSLADASGLSGHGFGPIPAPGSFAGSAFPVPPEQQLWLEPSFGHFGSIGWPFIVGL